VTNYKFNYVHSLNSV